MLLPYQPEEQAILINRVFGKFALPLEPKVSDLVKVITSQVGIMQGEVDEFRSATTEDDWRDALVDIVITGFGLPYLMGMSRVTPTIIANTRVNPEDVRGSCFTIRDHLISTGHGVATRLATLEDDSEFFAGRDNVHQTHMDALTTALQELSELDAQDYVLQSTISGDDIHDLSEDEYSAYMLVAKILSSCSTLITEVYLTSIAAQVNIDHDYYIATSAMLSRLCRNKDVAEATIAKYTEQGVSVAMRESRVVPGSYVIYVTEDCTSDEGEFMPENKFLKSIEFQVPVYPARPGAEWVHATPESLDGDTE